MSPLTSSPCRMHTHAAQVASNGKNRTMAVCLLLCFHFRHDARTRRRSVISFTVYTRLSHLVRYLSKKCFRCSNNCRKLHSRLWIDWWRSTKGCLSVCLSKSRSGLTTANIRSIWDQWNSPREFYQRWCIIPRYPRRLCPIVNWSKQQSQQASECAKWNGTCCPVAIER